MIFISDPYLRTLNEPGMTVGLATTRFNEIILVNLSVSTGKGNYKSDKSYLNFLKQWAFEQFSSSTNDGYELIVFRNLYSLALGYERTISVENDSTEILNAILSDLGRESSSTVDSKITRTSTSPLDDSLRVSLKQVNSIDTGSDSLNESVENSLNSISKLQFDESISQTELQNINEVIEKIQEYSKIQDDDERNELFYTLIDQIADATPESFNESVSSRLRLQIEGIITGKSRTKDFISNTTSSVKKNTNELVKSKVTSHITQALAPIDSVMNFFGMEGLGSKINRYQDKLFGEDTRTPTVRKGATFTSIKGNKWSNSEKISEVKDNKQVVDKQSKDIHNKQVVDKQSKDIYSKQVVDKQVVDKQVVDKQVVDKQSKDIYNKQVVDKQVVDKQSKDIHNKQVVDKQSKDIYNKQVVDKQSKDIIESKVKEIIPRTTSNSLQRDKVQSSKRMNNISNNVISIKRSLTSIEGLLADSYKLQFKQFVRDGAYQIRSFVSNLKLFKTLKGKYEKLKENTVSKINDTKRNVVERFNTLRSKRVSDLREYVGGKKTKLIEREGRSRDVVIEKYTKGSNKLKQTFTTQKDNITNTVSDIGRDRIQPLITNLFRTSNVTKPVTTNVTHPTLTRSTRAVYSDRHNSSNMFQTLKHNYGGSIVSKTTKLTNAQIREKRRNNKRPVSLKETNAILHKNLIENKKQTKLLKDISSTIDIIQTQMLIGSVMRLIDGRFPGKIGTILGKVKSIFSGKKDRNKKISPSKISTPSSNKTTTTKTSIPTTKTSTPASIYSTNGKGQKSETGSKVSKLDTLDKTASRGLLFDSSFTKSSSDTGSQTNKTNQSVVKKESSTSVNSSNRTIVDNKDSSVKSNVSTNKKGFFSKGMGKVGTKLASRAALALLGPVGAVIGAGLLAKDVYDYFSDSEEDKTSKTSDTSVQKERLENTKTSETSTLSEAAQLALISEQKLNEFREQNPKTDANSIVKDSVFDTYRVYKDESLNETSHRLNSEHLQALSVYKKIKLSEITKSDGVAYTRFGKPLTQEQNQEYVKRFGNNNGSFPTSESRSFVDSMYKTNLINDAGISKPQVQIKHKAQTQPQNTNLVSIESSSVSTTTKPISAKTRNVKGNEVSNVDVKQVQNEQLVKGVSSAVVNSNTSTQPNTTIINNNISENNSGSKPSPSQPSIVLPPTSVNGNPVIVNF